MREMGYKVSMYSEVKDLITAKGWENCAANNPAFSCKVDGVFTVFVADDAADITKAIVHELGHAELGHALDFEKPKEIRLEEDDEANEFVPYFLAPPCYLNGLNIKTLEELEEMLPYGHRLCKEIWANLTAWQQRHNPITYEEECICKMMGVAPQGDTLEDPPPETKSEPEAIPEVKEESKPNPESTPEPVPKSNQYYHEPTLSTPPKVEKQVEIRYIPQPISTPVPQIDKKQQKILAGMGALLIVLLCALCVFIGRSSATSNTPQSMGQGYYIIQQPQDTNQQPSMQQPVPQIPGSSSPSSDFTSSQPENRIVSSVEDEGTLVYITTSGKKYHKWGCQYIVGKTNLIDMYISEAQDKGYTPCSKCFPK